MPLPGWYAAALAKHAAKQRALAESVQPLELPVRDSFSTAPGWRELGIEYTCVPDTTYPWDPAVLKAIWTFDPGAIPMWVRWAFLSPSEGQEEVVVFGRHAIGRHVRNPHAQLHPLHVSMPSMPCQGVRFERPNLIEMVVLGEPDPRASDLPGAYLSFGWGLYAYLRARYAERSAKALFKVSVLDPREASEARLQKAREEEAYRKADVQTFIDRKLSEVSEVEMKERFLGSRTKAKPQFLDMAKGGLPAA